MSTEEERDLGIEVLNGDTNDLEDEKKPEEDVLVEPKPMPLPAPVQQAVVPVVRPIATIRSVEDDEDDEDLDETLAERVWGLTEMFPESLRNFSYKLTEFTFNSSKFLYHIGRVGMWVAASSGTILALPVMFETERAQMEEQQLAQQRQILLGPNAAVSGGGPGALGALPTVVPPQQR